MKAPEGTAIVVGGGPAGLATAIALRRHDFEVTIFDRGEPPIDKACGEGIMPAGVRALDRLGVRRGALEGREFRGIKYLGERFAGELPSEAVALVREDRPPANEAREDIAPDDIVEVRGDLPEPGGLAVRRTALQRALVERAEEVGVDLRWRTAVRGLVEYGVTTDDGHHRARWILGADGLHSRVRQWGGFGPVPSRRPARFGVRRHYDVRPWSDDVEVYWGNRCEAYVWGLAGDEVGVAILWSGGKSSFDRLLQRFPRLEKRLAGATPTSHDQGAGPFDQRVREPSRGHLALVGDAAGYRDAITGEGVALSLEQALALADCLGRGSLKGYPRALRRLTARPYAFIRLLLFVEQRPAMRRRMLDALADDPWIFQRLLDIHAGAAPLTSLGIVGGWTLVRRLILDGGY